MSDAILTPADKEEALSRAYVAVVAASAGYTLATQNFDRDGIDLQIRAGGLTRPSLDIQLKATVNLQAASQNEFRYRLHRRNYDLLIEETMVPRILVVLDLPGEESSWVNVTAEELAIRRCAYWVSLVGYPETENTATVTISIDRENLFDVKALRAMMEKIRQETAT